MLFFHTVTPTQKVPVHIETKAKKKLKKKKKKKKKRIKLEYHCCDSHTPHTFSSLFIHVGVTDLASIVVTQLNKKE